MHRIAVLLAALSAALLPFAAHAAGKFSVESAEVKPNVKISDKQVYKGFGCEGATFRHRLHGAMRRRERRASQ